MAINQEKLQRKLDAMVAKNIATLFTAHPTLPASDKLIADKILAGENYDLNASDVNNYNRLVALVLYKFITS